MNSEFFVTENYNLIEEWEELIFMKLDCQGTNSEREAAYKEGLKLLEMYKRFCENYGGAVYFEDMFINITWGEESEYFGQVMSVKDVFLDKTRNLKILVN